MTQISRLCRWLFDRYCHVSLFLPAQLYIELPCLFCAIVTILVYLDIDMRYDWR